MRVRLRALALLLAITAGDCLLWHWSVNAGHDVVALAAGLALLPLIALSAGALGMSVLRATGRSLRRASTGRPGTRRSGAAREGAQPAGAEVRQRQGSTDKLAA